MKLLERKFLKTYNAIIAALMTLLGFSSSCEKNKIGPVEYGTPHADFIINGKVESIIDNAPIENIRVIMDYDTSYTNNEGLFSVKSSNFPTEQTYTVRFKDIDGISNGEFEDIDTLVEFTDPAFTNSDGSWYSGETTKELNIKLRPKQ